MLSELSYSSLEREIQFLRLDLNGLSVELNIQQIYQTWYNPAVTDTMELKKALFNWKKTRLEALELFARAQTVITEMMQITPVPLPSSKRIYKRKKWPKKTKNATCPNEKPKLKFIQQNLPEKDVNKENQEPPSTQALTNQIETNKVTIKIEGSEGIEIKTEDSVSFWDTLKNLKKENTDDETVLNNNVDPIFVPQLPVANVKVECNIVKNEANEIRKRKKSRAERRRAKRAKLQ